MFIVKKGDAMRQRFLCSIGVVLLCGAAQLVANPATLDTTFNLTGAQQISFGSGSVFNNCYAVALQVDGKIVVAGNEDNGGGIYKFVIARLNTNGSFDTTFNLTGTQTLLIGDSATGKAVIEQTDGKLVEVGQETTLGVDRIAVARFNINGSLDTSFNTTGTNTVLLGTAAQGNAVALQTDGKIVVAGSATIAAVNECAVARFTTAGILDTTFNTLGSQVLLLGTAAQANAVALQTNGKIIVAGSATVGGVSEFAAARFNTDGSLDTSFNSTGTNTVLLGTAAQGNAVALQSDGKIVIAGTATVSGVDEIGVARLNADGTLDTTFNLTGTQTISFGGSFAVGRAVAVQTNGTIVVVGSSDNTLAVARLKTDGSLDTSFNGTGKMTLLLEIGLAGTSVALQTDGKIVAAGNISFDGASQLEVIRLLGDPIYSSCCLYVQSLRSLFL